MVMPRRDSEPPMAVASRWVSQITSIALEMALPAGAGYWCDRRWGTSPWLVLVGAALGLYVATASFMQLVKSETARNQVPKTKPSETSDESGKTQ